MTAMPLPRRTEKAVDLRRASETPLFIASDGHKPGYARYEIDSNHFQNPDSPFFRFLAANISLANNPSHVKRLAFEIGPSDALIEIVTAKHKEPFVFNIDLDSGYVRHSTSPSTKRRAKIWMPRLATLAHVLPVDADLKKLLADSLNRAQKNYPVDVLARGKLVGTRPQFGTAGVFAPTDSRGYSFETRSIPAHENLIRSAAVKVTGISPEENYFAPGTTVINAKTAGGKQVTITVSHRMPDRIRVDGLSSSGTLANLSSVGWVKRVRQLLKEDRNPMFRAAIDTMKKYGQER